MNYNIDTLLTELRSTIADLGKGGGSISPSVYDTAQVLRLFPPEDPEPAFQWLLSQQKADGGWGSPETPYTRDVPTLAAVLALRTYRETPAIQEAIDAGVQFLREGADKWEDVPIDALPVACEMLLPYLLQEANLYSLTFNLAPYATLYRFRNYKQQQLNKRALQLGTPPTYSWEALGKSVDSILPDQSGGIGHSPAATAAWLQQARNQPDLAAPCKLAQRYLARSAMATALNIPGVVPSLWPITGFELTYALCPLLVTGLIQHPALRDVISPLLNDLWIIMQRGHGVNLGEYFTPDGDDTGIALGMLHASGYKIDPDVILQFKNGDHFYTYRHELNPSVLTNAHALYGLAYVGRRYPAAEHFLLKRQSDDGRWQADKWHTSWLYATLEVMLTLDKLGYTSQVKHGLQTFIQNQKADGGWGSGQSSTCAETSYAILGFSTLQQHGALTAEAMNALQRGYQWLSNRYRSNLVIDDRSLWLGKELYTPHRVNRVYELTALFSIMLERVTA